MRRAVKLVLQAAVVLALALWVWSARYRYDHLIMDGNTYIVRIHRVTGHADILIPEDGWVPAEDAWSQTPDEMPNRASRAARRAHLSST